MMGRLDRDESEERKCYDSHYAKKFKSFRDGYRAGKRDGLSRSEEKPERNPYILSPEILALLKKRARWEAGYALGHQIGGRKRVAKEKKRIRRG